MLKLIELQTKCIADSVGRVREMLSGCEEMAKDNYGMARSRKEIDIAFKYEHIVNDLGSIVRQLDMVLRELADEKRNERDAMLRAKKEAGKC